MIWFCIQFGAVVAWFLYRADFMTTYLFTTPLKHLYRNGELVLVLVHILTVWFRSCVPHSVW